MPDRPASTSDLDLNELQAIVDGSSDCIKVLDLDGHLLSMNAGGMETMEIEDFGSCQYVMWPEFWKGEAKTQVQQALEAARAGQTVNFEGPANTFLGTPRWWEVRVSPIRDQGGKVTRLLAISRDVTARRTAEERLLENERGLQKRATELEFQVGQQALALNAFVRFTTVVASSTELEVIAAAAAEILGDVVEGAISGFFLVRGDTAYPLVFSANTPEAVITARRRGVPLSAPLVSQAFDQNSVAFADGATGQQQSVGYATALSITPYFAQGQPYALLATGTERSAWTAQEQAVIESVGRGLGLALERSQQSDQLQKRTAGLDAFVAFSERSGKLTDILDLAQQAVDVLRATLGVVSVAYYRLHGDRWKAQVWSDDFSPEVISVLTAGIPVTAPSYAEAVQTREAVFVPGWTADAEGVANTEAFGAGAFYPCFVGDVPSGLLAMGTQQSSDWTPREQAVFGAVGHSLTLALERTEQARLLTEQRDVLDHRTRELEATNAELEAFTYSASHDLRTPVRHVMGFAELAELGLKNGQYDKTAQYLGVVKQGALRMTALIDGMLLLSRSGRKVLQVQRVDLNALVSQAQRDAGAEFAGHPVRWQIGALPPVQGDPGLLQQVMTNLLSNAVKYSSTRELSVIQVWAQQGDAETEVFVKDNGVGFDPRYTDKLFGLFQRLHTEKQFTGTGVGLATVRRIVLKHGGQVTARSLDDEGAVFSFTLPKAGGVAAQPGSRSTNP
ncbi:ATP-binding protein (plasmid) [Deinococcus radiomollis]|uniref:PAS domain-containing sensor histidine kinase n=1 Tax=Deinococcus radiomollis TaxID=468916 RepID=UPI0038918825